MIDSNFIIRYTNALYSVPKKFSPKYNEFRDMFSGGQIRSKDWLIKVISDWDSGFNPGSAIIVGAWFGTLGVMLKQKYPELDLTLLDIDPRCEQFIKVATADIWGLKAVTADMYSYKYKENLVINTSCEHLLDPKKWLSLLPKDTLVALQSNNAFHIDGHINCVNSESEFINLVGLDDVWYSGKLEMPMYTRFMIFGKT